LLERAIETVPRTCFAGENSAVRPAHAGAGGVARLRHEIVDHAMEDDAVIEALAHQFRDPRHMARREIGPRGDGDGTMRGFQDDGVGHENSLE
jgi:hypothetical protein